MPRSESEQRAKILDAAIGVFADKGRKGATIRLVAKEADVNSALIYYYFENKHALFLDAIEFVMSRFFDHLARRRRSFRNARERLAYLVDGVLGYFTEYPGRMRLLMQVFILHPQLLGEMFTRFLKDRAIVPLEVLGEGIATGELRTVHPLQAWWSIIGMCLFSLRVRDVAAGVNPLSIPMPLPTTDERRTQIVDLLVQGLATKQEMTT